MKKRVVMMLLSGTLAMSSVFPAVAAESGGSLTKSETVFVKADADGEPQEITVSDLLELGGMQGEIEDFSTLSDIKNTEGDEEYRQEADGRLFWENHGENISYEGKSNAELPVAVKVRYYLDGKEMSPEDMAGVSGRIKIRFEYENRTSETVETDGNVENVKVPFVAITALMLPSDVFSNVEVSNGKVIADKDQSIVAGVAFPGLADSLKLDEYEVTEDVSVPDHVEVTADAKDFALALTATIVSSGALSDLDTSDLDDAEDLADSMEELTDASSKLADGAGELTKGIETMQGYLGEYTQGVGAVSDGAKSLAEGLSAGSALLRNNKEALADGAAKLTEGLASLNTVLGEVELPGELSEAAAAARQLGTDAEELAEELDAITGSLGAAGGSLDAIDLSEVDTKVSAQATEQARKAAQDKVDAVLSGLVEDEKMTEEEAALLKSEVDYGDIQIQISGAAAQAQELIAQAKQSMEDAMVALNISAAETIVADMQGQIGVLEKYSGDISGMSTTIAGLRGALGQLGDGVESMAAGSQMLTQGIAAIDEGISAAYEGALGLSEGSAQLAFAGAQLGGGLGSLAQGSSILQKGMETFDEEGIQKLADLAGDDLTAVLGRFKALKEADRRYENYAGIKEGTRGEVKFIIETEEIEAE